MRNVTQQTVNAFMNGRAKKQGNTETDGQSLYLHGNKIAEHRADGLHISNGGFFPETGATGSNTTKERLNGLPGVRISQQKFKWYLNGNEWDGGWIKVNSNTPPETGARVGHSFDLSTKYNKTDGWRGYESPVYAVAGANDTGMWEDSPCRSDVAERELNAVKSDLKSADIPVKLKTCQTSNVFCVHHYLVVPPVFFEQAKQIVSAHISSNETRLLYTVN